MDAHVIFVFGFFQLPLHHNHVFVLFAQLKQSMNYQTIVNLNYWSCENHQKIYILIWIFSLSCGIEFLLASIFPWFWFFFKISLNLPQIIIINVRACEIDDGNLFKCNLKDLINILLMEFTLNFGYIFEQWPYIFYVFFLFFSH